MRSIGNVGGKWKESSDKGGDDVEDEIIEMRGRD